MNYLRLAGIIFVSFCLFSGLSLQAASKPKQAPKPQTPKQEKAVKINIEKEIKNLKGKDISKRLLAIRQLGRTKDPRAADELSKYLKQVKDSGIKSYIIASLGSIGNDEALNTLVDTFLDQKINADVRLEALDGLSRIKDEKVGYSSIILATQDKEPKIRKVGAGFLWQMYYPQKPDVVKAVLKRMLDNDNDEAVKSFIRKLPLFDLKKQ